MKTIIDVLGEITAEERERLFSVVEHKSLSELIPGDGIVLAENEGVPPRIAYLNRRIYLHTEKAFVKLIFEVGAPPRAPVQIDRQKLLKDAQEFVIRKSAAFSRPDIAAKELTNFFITFMGG